MKEKHYWVLSMEPGRWIARVTGSSAVIYAPTKDDVAKTLKSIGCKRINLGSVESSGLELWVQEVEAE